MRLCIIRIVAALAHVIEILLTAEIYIDKLDWRLPNHLFLDKLGFFFFSFHFKTFTRLEHAQDAFRAL